MAKGRNTWNRQKKNMRRAMPGALALLLLLPVLTVIIGGAGAVTQSEIDALKQEQEESQARQEALKEQLSRPRRSSPPRKTSGTCCWNR